MLRRMLVAVSMLLVVLPGAAEDKTDSPGPHHSGEAVRATGGPDDFGYVFYDNVELECTGLYNYVDITATGTATGMAGLDDNNTAGLPMGFSFPFYGSSYTTFYAGTNGTLYFVDGYLGFQNVCPLPGTNYSPVEAYIVPYQDDLEVQGNGDIYYQTFASCPVGAGGQCTIVQFHNMTDYGSTDDNMDFEAVLYADGTVVLQYLATANDDANQTNGASATVGIQGSATTPPLYALEYSCNTESLSPGLAIAFAPPGAQTLGVPDVCAVAQATADLEISKTTTAQTFQAGEQVTYTLEVTNNGPDAATGVVVTDVIPAGLTYVSNTCGGTFDGGTDTFTWNIGGLAASASVSCSLVVSVDLDATGFISNSASVSGAEADPTPGNDASTVRIEVFQLRPIPTVGAVGLAVLALLTAGAGILVLRRRF